MTQFQLGVEFDTFVLLRFDDGRIFEKSIRFSEVSERSKRNGAFTGIWESLNMFSPVDTLVKYEENLSFLVTTRYLRFVTAA